MNEKLKNFTDIIKTPKVLIIIGMCGILLIGISTIIPSDSEKETVSVSQQTDAEQYRLSLEESIKQTVAGITGNENITVLITLESGIKYSYAKEAEGASENKTESNSESYSSENKQSYIIIKDSSGSEQALLITEEMPEVRGVSIICQGGDDEKTADKIKNAVTAALNITSKRVYIAGGTGYEDR